MQKLLFYPSKTTNDLYSREYMTKTWLEHLRCSGVVTVGCNAIWKRLPSNRLQLTQPSKSIFLLNCHQNVSMDLLVHFAAAILSYIITEH